MARYLTRESEPYGKWKNIPIYLTTILTALLVVGFLVSAVLASARSPWLQTLAFRTPVSEWSGWLSVLSYPFIELPTFFTPLGIVCFYWWSAGIETHLGRGPLVRLLLILVLLPVAWLGVLAISGISHGGLAGGFLRPDRVLRGRLLLLPSGVA